MLSDRINEALNSQLNKEFYSAYLYMSISAVAEECGLFGFAKWLRKQSQEEIEHGEKIFDFLIDRKGSVTLEAISKPEFCYNNPLELFKFIYEHEKSITKSIMELAQQAEDECDRMTTMFLDWYINEQVEEESSVLKIIKQLNQFGENGGALYLIDNEAGKRE